MHGSIRESQQYSPRSVRRYEKIFGADFLSSGGGDTTKAICETLDIRAGTRVLDVGSGLGGSAFYMSRAYGAVVTGVDILPQMVELATQRARERGVTGVTFVHGDILELDMPAVAYDLVYSRDALLYVEDKPTLFRKLYRLLAPRGRLFVSDYARGPDPLSDDFIDYVKDAGYYLQELAAYGDIVEAAGFLDVVVLDKTEIFVAVMQREMEDIRGSLQEPEYDGLEAGDRDYLLKRWEKKTRWCNAGDMKWGHFYARRP